MKRLPVKSIATQTLVVSILICLTTASVNPRIIAQEQKPPEADRFVQMAKIIERSNRAARYASKIKARYANDPKTLAEAESQYNLAKDKFDAWLTVLGLAILNKQKKAINGSEFKSIADEANQIATKFESYAEGLTGFKEPNPLTPPTPAPKRKITASTETAMTSPDPIILVADLIVTIGFKVYDRWQQGKAAERAQFVNDMRQVASWKDWSAVQKDSGIEALPAPTPTPAATPTPTPKASPSPTP